MKKSWIFAGVFLVALGLTGLWRTRGGGVDGRAVADGSGKEREQAAGLEGRRARSRAGVAESEPLLARVRRKLRVGQVKEALALLEAGLAGKPRDAAEAKERMWLLGGLPLFEGREALCRRLAGDLPWGDAESLKLIEDCRDPHSGWEGYIGAQLGQRTDEEILAWVTRSKSPDVSVMLRDAAEKRPAEFARVLGQHPEWLYFQAFLNEAMGTHPEAMPGIVREVVAGAKPGLDTTGVYARCLEQEPTAANVQGIVAARGEKSMLSADVQVVTKGYEVAPEEERAKLREWMAGQSPMRRNELVASATSMHLGGEDLAKLLDVAVSGATQQQTLEEWFQLRPELAAGVKEDTGWVEQMPTERLRKRARELVAGRAGGKG